MRLALRRAPSPTMFPSPCRLGWVSFPPVARLLYARCRKAADLNHHYLCTRLRGSASAPSSSDIPSLRRRRIDNRHRNEFVDPRGDPARGLGR